MILVTGAAGFIGSHLCEALLENGFEVVGVDNFDPYYDCRWKQSNLRMAFGHNRFEFQQRDVRDVEAMEAICAARRPETIVHLAGRPGVRDSVVFPKLYADININGTLSVLEAMRRNGLKHLVFASSSSVYGGVKELPYREASAPVPLSPYAATKAAAEALCSSYAAVYGIQTTCLRFFTVYGPRQRPDMAISKFARALLAGRSIKVYGDGSSSRDYTYVGDIVAGVLRAIERPFPLETVNLGSNTPIPLSSMISILSSALGVRPLLNYVPAETGEPERTLADISKAERLLDYRPSISFELGIEHFCKWLHNSESVDLLEASEHH